MIYSLTILNKELETFSLSPNEQYHYKTLSYPNYNLFNLTT